MAQGGGGAQLSAQTADFDDARSEWMGSQLSAG